jgi:hypothetical protein
LSNYRKKVEKFYLLGRINLNIVRGRTFINFSILV